MSGLDIIYIVTIVWLSWMPFVIIFCLLLPCVLRLIFCSFREIPCTIEVSHMLSVPSVEMKVSWVCIRGLEQHCWYVHNVLYSIFIMLCSYYWHSYSFSAMQGVGPSIAISFSVYEWLRSVWQSQRWISVVVWNFRVIVQDEIWFCKCYLIFYSFQM